MLALSRCTLVSILRAYYTSILTFEDLTDSRTNLDILSAIEPAVSIIVASSFVLGPLLQKWFHAGVENNVSPKYVNSFHRLKESERHRVSGDIELLQSGTVASNHI